MDGPLDFSEEISVVKENAKNLKLETAHKSKENFCFLITTTDKVHIYLEGHFFTLLKGQLISKGLFGILNSPKKRTKKLDFTSMIPQVDLFSFVFWEKLKTQKRHFEIK